MKKMLTKNEMDKYLVEYKIDNELLQDDDDMLNQIFEYNSGQIDDIISEIADYNVGIYYHELDENENNLLKSRASQNYDDEHQDKYDKLMFIWFMYNDTVLNNNLEELLHNYVIHYLIKNNIKVSEEEIEDIIYDFSMCDHLDELEEIVKSTIEWYRNKEE